MYTDYEALLSLMNNLHPYGKLVHRGIALQELDLTIHYHPGKLNQSADSLSRCSRSEVGCLQTKEDTPHSQLVSAKDREELPVPLTEIQLTSAKDREEMTLSARQVLDPELAMVVKYLQSGILPPDDKKAKELILGKTRYVMIEDVLYHLTADQDSRW